MMHTQDKSDGHDKDFEKCPDTGIIAQGKQYGTCGMTYQKYKYSAQFKQNPGSYDTIFIMFRI